MRCILMLQILRKEVDESLPKQILSALLQHDLDTNNSERYSLLMDAPRFSTVEEVIVTQYTTNAIGTDNRIIYIQHIYSEMNLGRNESRQKEKPVQLVS